mmetsp:Transcript_72065/g.192592  ORF Transcript_72065/g.192592 Transcript_72065/m.192592 type:complete len:147 (-) Transcript_72065:564-1004(-)
MLQGLGRSESFFKKDRGASARHRNRPILMDCQGSEAHRRYLNNTHFLYSRNHTGIHLDQIRAHLFTKDQQATKDCLLLLRCFCAANLIVTLKKKNTRPAIMSSVSIDGIKVSRSARMRSIAISILEIMIGHISPMFGGRRERLSCA